MPGARSTLSGTPLPIRAFVLATWTVFLAAILLLNAPSPRGVYYIINAIGLLGFGASIVWFLVGRNWRYVCIALSVLLIVIYLLRWFLQVEQINATSPELGLGTAIERLVRVWTSMFSWNDKNYGLIWALLAAYWDVLIVPVQIVVTAIMFIYRPDGNRKLA